VVFLWSGLVGVLAMVIYALAGHGIIALLTGIPEVRAAAAAYLFAPVVLPVIAVWAYTYDGVYLAATRTTPMRNTVMLSFAVYVTVLFTLVPVYGNIALWIALAAFLGLRGLLLHLLYPALLRTI
jgi:MATE family multidrug resistance protein